MVRLYFVMESPLDAARGYAQLIREGRWNEIEAAKLKELLRQLAEDAKDNLDRPVRRPSKLSGKQAASALYELFRALSAKRRGARRRSDTWLAERFKPFDRILAQSLGVRGSPTGSMAEYLAWEATELLRSRVEARRRKKAAKQSATMFEVFSEKLLPRLTSPGREDASISRRVLLERYRSALATIGAAGSPTETAIRYCLGLSYRAKRKIASRRRISKRINKGQEHVNEETLIARGLKILGIRLPT